jgi:hypothetical protein
MPLQAGVLDLAQRFIAARPIQFLHVEVPRWRSRVSSRAIGEAEYGCDGFGREGVAIKLDINQVLTYAQGAACFVRKSYLPEGLVARLDYPLITVAASSDGHAKSHGGHDHRRTIEGASSTRCLDS